jgi:hypothetical protein
MCYGAWGTLHIADKFIGTSCACPSLSAKGLGGGTKKETYSLAGGGIIQDILTYNRGHQFSAAS